MKIIVIENNHNFNKKICKYLNQVLIENNLNWNPIPFLNFNDELNEIIHDKEIKIYIIDIKLSNNFSGYDICRLIRESAYDWDSIIIISSIHNQKEDFISLRLSIFTYLSKHLVFTLQKKVICEEIYFQNFMIAIKTINQFC